MQELEALSGACPSGLRLGQVVSLERLLEVWWSNEPNARSLDCTPAWRQSVQGNGDISDAGLRRQRILLQDLLHLADMERMEWLLQEMRQRQKIAPAPTQGIHQAFQR